MQPLSEKCALSEGGVRSALIALSVLFHSLICSASSCDGLAPGQVDRVDAPGRTLAGVPPLDQHITRQFCVKKLGIACFASCASATATTLFAAWVQGQGGPLLPPFGGDEESLKYTFLEWGDANRGGGRSGNVTVILPGLKTDLEGKVCAGEVTPAYAAYCQAALGKKLLFRYQDVSFATQSQAAEIFARHFSSPEPIYPMPIVYNPRVLTQALAKRDDGHASLLTGRRRDAEGRCELLVRNSWGLSLCQAPDVPGKTPHYGGSARRECDPATNSVWVDEEALLGSMSGFDLLSWL